VIIADQHSLDTSRAELNAKNGLSAINYFLGIVSIHVHLSGLEVISSNLVFREETVFIPRYLYSPILSGKVARYRSQINLRTATVRGHGIGSNFSHFPWAQIPFGFVWRN
jgi:hypothetical protein